MADFTALGRPPRLSNVDSCKAKSVKSREASGADSDSTEPCTQHGPDTLVILTDQSLELLSQQLVITWGVLRVTDHCIRLS